MNPRTLFRRWNSPARPPVPSPHLASEPGALVEEAAPPNDPVEAGEEPPAATPQLTPEALQGRVWSFGVPGEWPLAPQLRLQPDGSIWGLWGVAEVSWAWVEGRLAFLDDSDLRRVVFDEVQVEPDGRLLLKGRGGEPGALSAERYLREVEAFSRLRAPPPDLQLESRPGLKRRNLVVLPAGESSLHPSWARDMPEEDRNWDLCVSFFGDPERFVPDPVAEHQVLQTRKRKFDALYTLFHQDSPLWEYDYVAFPDDDLQLSWRDWNRLFATCRRYGLDLAQPSITGFPNQPIVRPDPAYLLRYTSWVEIMTPIFSNRALRLCMPTFEGSLSGYGLDHVWPKLLGEPHDRVAIIDAVSAVHTRPGNAGTAGYDYQAALHEGAQAQGKYGAPWRTVEFGGIRREPRERHEDW